MAKYKNAHFVHLLFTLNMFVFIIYLAIISSDHSGVVIFTNYHKTYFIDTINCSKVLLYFVLLSNLTMCLIIIVNKFIESNKIDYL